MGCGASGNAASMPADSPAAPANTIPPSNGRELNSSQAAAREGAPSGVGSGSPPTDRALSDYEKELLQEVKDLKSELDSVKAQLEARSSQEDVVDKKRRGTRLEAELQQETQMQKKELEEMNGTVQEKANELKKLHEKMEELIQQQGQGSAELPVEDSLQSTAAYHKEAQSLSEVQLQMQEISQARLMHPDELNQVLDHLSDAKHKATAGASEAARQAEKAVKSAAQAEHSMRIAVHKAKIVADMHEGGARLAEATKGAAEAALEWRVQQEEGHDDAPPSPRQQGPMKGDVLRKQARTVPKGPERIAMYEQALACYDEDIAKGEVESLAYYGKGVTLRKLNRDLEAVACFEAALKADKEHAACWDNLGQSYLKLARYDEAVQAYQCAVTLCPDKKEYERGLKQAEAHRVAALEQQEKQLIAEAAKEEAETLKMAMQRAVLARAAAEQELTNAQRRAAEAEQLADAAIQAKKDAGGGGQPKGIHEYELIYNIGEGASAQVWIGKSPQNQAVAVKAIEKNTNAVEPWRVVEEKEIMEALAGHPYIVNLDAAFQTRTTLYFVMSYAAGGDLYSYMEGHAMREETLERKEALLYAAELALAIDHLHESNIVYRDLKPENVLVTGEGHVCMTDFGLSRRVKFPGGPKNAPTNGKLLSVLGTPEYMAPEVLTKKGHGKAVDWWGLGVLIYELVFGLGNVPFEAEEQLMMFRKILSQPPNIPSDADAATKSLLKELFNKDKDQRMAFSDLKDHEWFKEIDWKKLYDKGYPAVHKPDIPEDVLSKWYEKAKKDQKDGEDEWDKFTQWTRGTNTNSKSPEAGGDSSLEAMRAAATTLIDYLLNESSPDLESRVAGIVDSGATFILQGDSYAGPAGYKAYRDTIGWGQSTVISNAKVSPARTLSAEEVQIAWEYTKQAPGAKSLRVSGASLFVFDANNKVVSGANSYKLPEQVEAGGRNKRRGAGAEAAPERSEPESSGMLSLMMGRVLEFAMLEEARNAREVERGLEAMMEEEADTDECAWGINVAKASATTSTAAPPELHGMSHRLHTAIQMWSGMEGLVHRRVAIQSLCPIGPAVFRVHMQLSGRLKNDPRTIAKMSGLQLTGLRIHPNAKVDYPVVLELTFDSETARIKHCRRYWSRMQVLTQLHVPPKPPEPIWDASLLQAQRQAAVDTVVHFSRHPWSTQPDEVKHQFTQILHPRVQFAAPDVFWLLPPETDPEALFHGRDAVTNVLKTLALEIQKRVDVNAVTEEVRPGQGRAGLGQLDWVSPDSCRVCTRKTAVGTQAISDSVVALCLGNGVKLEALPDAIAGRQIAMELIWRFHFEENSPQVKDISFAEPNSEQIQQTGLLPNFTMYKDMASE